MRNDDEEKRHERKMIWLARGIIFLAVAWFFAEAWEDLISVN